MPGVFCQSPEFCEKSVFVKGTDNQFSELFINSLSLAGEWDDF
jgi:hypothetical protein